MLIVKFLIIHTYICIIWAFIIYSTEQCSCDNFEIDYCDSQGYCSWNDNACGKLICENRIQKYCSGYSTNYRCDWDKEKKLCVNKDFKCSDFDKSDCQNSFYYDSDCIWTKEEKCEVDSCSPQDQDFCRLDICQFQRKGSTKECKKFEITNIACQSYQMEECQQYSNGKGDYCHINDNYKCLQYSLYAPCNQWSDSKEQCNLFSQCFYENNTCRNRTCSDIIEMENCKFIQDYLSQELRVCFWANDQCTDATEKDLDSFSIRTCLKNTNFHFKWTENAGCQKCSNQRVEYPSLPPIDESPKNDSQLTLILCATLIPFAVIIAITLYIIRACRRRNMPKQEKEKQNEEDNNEKDKFPEYGPQFAD